MKPITTRPASDRTAWPFPAAMQHAPRLPDLCQCGGLHSRICECGTKGCTVDHQHGKQSTAKDIR